MLVKLSRVFLMYSYFATINLRSNLHSLLVFTSLWVLRSHYDNDTVE